MNKKIFVAALALFLLASINVLRADAQTCQNVETFGVHTNLAVNKTLQSQIEITYFTTNDPHVFMSERAGIGRSASYMSLDTNQFVAKIEKLERDGVARIRKQQRAISYLGEVAELNLERNAVNAGARIINASLAASNYLSGLDRNTEISVNKGLASDGDYYHVGLLSWFVNGTAGGVEKIVDYDTNILLKPGQTAVFKLLSDYEIKRSGSARSYIAVTMRAINKVDSASIEHSRRAVAIR